MFWRAVCSLCLLLLGACADIPALDTVEGDDVRDAPYPRLLPLEQLLDPVAEPVTDEETSEDLQARAEALRDRADRLSEQSVVDRGTRQRMDDGVQPQG